MLTRSNNIKRELIPSGNKKVSNKQPKNIVKGTIKKDKQIPKCQGKERNHKDQSKK